MDLGLIQRELAVELGVSTNIVRRWELSLNEPSVRHWPTIIDFLGYDPIGPPETLAELLKTARRYLGLSHRLLGKFLGLDPSAIYKWEHGKVPRNVRSWLKLEPMFDDLGIGLEIRRELWPRRYRARRHS